MYRTRFVRFVIRDALINFIISHVCIALSIMLEMSTCVRNVHRCVWLQIFTQRFTMVKTFWWRKFFRKQKHRNSKDLTIVHKHDVCAMQTVHCAMKHLQNSYYNFGTGGAEKKTVHEILKSIYGTFMNFAMNKHDEWHTHTYVYIIWKLKSLNCFLRFL